MEQPTIEKVVQLAKDAGCIRTIDVTYGLSIHKTMPVLVPPTDNWAGWTDAQAIAHHGKTAENLLDRFLTLSNEPWDGTYGHLWDFQSHYAE